MEGRTGRSSQKETYGTLSSGSPAGTPYWVRLLQELVLLPLAWPHQLGQGALAECPTA